MRKDRFILFVIAVLVVALLAVGGAVIHSAVSVKADNIETEDTEIESAERVAKLIVYYPNNCVCSCNTLSTDNSVEVSESGFKYYSISEEYVKYGGYFPEEVQKYLWELCEQRDIDYYIAVALIERESDYKCNASGDSGNSVGYMQVYEKWHKERMEAEGVTDLTDPYGNIRVGLSFFDELYEKYGDYTLALMCYNMGESGAKKCWAKGIYESEYAIGIQKRAQEIKQELQQA